MFQGLITLSLAYILGVIPILFWLWILEHEDKNPEPHKVTILAFIAGMAAVALTIPFEKMVLSFTSDLAITIICWAAIEELIKLGVAYFVVLRRAENDEPIDSVMYMFTVALGFSALENALFISNPLSQNETMQAIITGSFRFVGATFLHTLASGVIGIALAFAFYKSEAVKRTYLAIGIIIAVTLHTLFNLTIILSEGSTILYAFYGVWIALIIAFIVLQKVKKVTNQS